VSLLRKMSLKFELQDSSQASLKSQHGILKNRSGRKVIYVTLTPRIGRHLVIGKTVLERLLRFLLLMMAKFKIEHG